MPARLYQIQLIVSKVAFKANRTKLSFFFLIEGPRDVIIYMNQGGLNTVSFSICCLKHLRQTTFFSDVTHVIYMQVIPHYSEVIMSTMASQITSLAIVYLTVHSGVTSLCEGNSLVTGEFPSQRASNAENVSIWWRHHEYFGQNNVINGFQFLKKSLQNSVFLLQKPSWNWIKWTVLRRPWLHCLPHFSGCDIFQCH